MRGLRSEANFVVLLRPEVTRFNFPVASVNSLSKALRALRSHDAHLSAFEEG